MMPASMSAGFLFTPEFLLRVSREHSLLFFIEKGKFEVAAFQLSPTCLLWVGLPLKPRGVLQLEPKC